MPPKNNDTSYISPIQSYYYMHNPIATLQWLWGLQLPQTSVERIYLFWYVKFATDCSGRTTGKSHDALAVINAKQILLPEQSAILLGQDKKIGDYFFNEYVTPWINQCPKYREFVVPWRDRGNKQATFKDSGAYLKYSNGSVFITFAPDWSKGAKTTQSHRYNRMIFNEWTSFPNMQAMTSEIEPIINRSNFIYRNTRLFREIMEKWMNEPLGFISNAELEYIHKGEPNYHARSYLKTNFNSKPFDFIREKFLNNFKETYLFDYEEGLKHPELAFKPIETIDDIRGFFKLFTEGDAPYQNQIIYDGSSKPPESPGFVWIEQLAKITGREVNTLAKKEEPNMTFDNWKNDSRIMDHRYSYYSVSIDDVPREFDGIIFDSGMINKFRQNNLIEVFEQVYGGKWISGFARKPYDAALIAKLRVTRDDPRYFESSAQGSRTKLYIGAIDAAKGKESLRKGVQEYRGLGHGGGDDAGGAFAELGEGTEANPDKLKYIYLAEDVRGEPVAFDIQNILKNFEQMIFLGLDPNGGGGAVADALKKNIIEKNGQTLNCVPILPVDYQGIEGGRQILVFISRNTQILRDIRVASSDDKSLWKGEDIFTNWIHTRAQDAIFRKMILFPPYYSEMELVEMLKENKISYERYEQLLHIEMAIKQLTEIEIELDPHTRKPALTKNGVYQYTAPHKKDLGYAIVYMLFLISIWREWQTLGQSRDDGIIWTY